MDKNLYLFDCFGVVLTEVSTLSMREFTDEQRRYMREQVFRRVDSAASGKATKGSITTPSRS